MSGDGITVYKTVPQILREGAATYEERNKLYGDNYKLIGHQFASMFPNGVTLKTPEDFNRFFLLFNVVGKAGRYAASFANGGHKDSAHDAMVYSGMLEEMTP